MMPIFFEIILWSALVLISHLSGDHASLLFGAALLGLALIRLPKEAIEDDECAAASARVDAMIARLASRCK